MILKCDAAQLEWRVKVFLSQDPIALKEIQENLDLHSDNQKVFGLPSRLISKVFLYRMIFADAFGQRGYGGPAYAYANDNDFKDTSTRPKFWENVIEKFFDKYKGIKEHSLNLIREATTTGKIVNPSGRFYNFEPVQKYDGSWDWPRTTILNYPVQGLAADFMMCARWQIRQWLLKDIWPKYGRDNVLLINTVHDDVEIDVDNNPELIYNISVGMIDAFRKIPEIFESKFDVKVNVPFDGEVKIGRTLEEKAMFKFNKETFKEDYNSYAI